jgi:hypothetical protein
MGKRQTVSNVLEAVPVFQGRELVVKRSGHSANQIVNEVLNAHVAFAGDYDLLVDEISFSRAEPLESQLFSFCKKNLHYVVEEGYYQSTRSPAGIIELGSIEGVGVDCKHYAGYIAGVLDAENRKAGKIVYDWSYRFASYDSNPEPGHVFVVIEKKSGEVWVDPVLKSLDQRFPRPRFYRDKKIDMPLVRLSGIAKRKKVGDPFGGNYTMGCNCKKGLGTTAETGAVISKVAPALAVIPVVGWVAAGAAEVVGMALQIFGNKWHASEPVRWLAAGYDYYVKGEAGVNSDNDINEADINPAVSWFSIVLGVPVFDTNDWGRLKGLNGSGTFVNNTFAQRAQNYISGSNATTRGIKVDPAAVAQAVQIADTMKISTNGVKSPPGSWAAMVAAPSTIATSPTEATLTDVTPTQQAASSASSNLFSNGVAWVQENPLPAAGIAAGVLLVGYLIFKKKK